MNLLSEGSAFKVHGEAVRLGFHSLKAKKVAPLNLEDAQQKGVLF